MEYLLAVVSFIGVMIGASQVSKVDYYAWNMPEAYMPARRAFIIGIMSGYILGISIFIR
jgi:hypothetical protein